MRSKKVQDELEILAEEIEGSKEWHHDIKYIGGEFVEVIVKRWQQLQDPDDIEKIIENYAIFRKKWGRGFAIFLGDQEDGEMMHDHLVWKAACRFEPEKTRKPLGKAFNAYLVSTLMNQLKNLRNTRTSFKNHPRVKCPICGEFVYQIDDKHLEHTYDLKRYVRKFPNYPLVSYDGLTLCPITGIGVKRITMEHMNRFGGRYTVEDFHAEFNIVRHGPYACPLTGVVVEKVDDAYFAGLLQGYKKEDFVNDFPDFPGLFKSPFNGLPMFEMKQKHLDEVLEQNEDSERYTDSVFEKKHPNFTMQVKQVPVTNPYTGQKVMELTPAMLAEAGTTVKEHLEKYATFMLDRHYFDLRTCPFTGRRTHVIKTSDLKSLAKTPIDFYQAVCSHPFRKFKVKCAVDGRWVDNIWDHLLTNPLRYAPKMTMEEFESNYGFNSTKLKVTTNSYVENDSGDEVHIGDLFVDKVQEFDKIELQDSLGKQAEDEIDKRIVEAVATAHTVEDVCFMAAYKKEIKLDAEFKSGMTKDVRRTVEKELESDDFDFVVSPKEGDTSINVMYPSRQTIKKRLERMISASDI